MSSTQQTPGTRERALPTSLRVQDPNQRCRHVRRYGGIDALVFTGGAGEASSRLRADTCAGLSFLGVRLLGTTNEGCTGDGVVSPSEASPAVIVVESREDIEIVHHVRELLA